MVRCPTVSETRPRRATIKASLVALTAGAAIAGTATFLNHGTTEHSGLEVPVVDGYNAANNQVRQTGSTSPTVNGTALSGPTSAAPPPSGSPSPSGSPTPSSSASPTPSTATSSQSSEQPPPPPPSSSSSSAPPPPPPPPNTGSPNAGEAAKVVQLVNQQREQAGCDDLRVDSRLTNAAQAHSTDMAQRNYFDHTTPEGVTFAQRIRAAGYPQPSAENIAKGQRSADEVMRAWMNSSGHRANILNCDYTAIGVGLDTNGWLWTQDFGF